jgi:hypothetical protein
LIIDFVSPSIQGSVDQLAWSDPMQRAEIQVKGRLDENWSEWFEGFEITYPGEGQTKLTGEVRDQTALYSLLSRLRDLGLPLVSVKCE